MRGRDGRDARDARDRRNGREGRDGRDGRGGRGLRGLERRDREAGGGDRDDRRRREQREQEREEFEKWQRDKEDELQRRLEEELAIERARLLVYQQSRGVSDSTKNKRKERKDQPTGKPMCLSGVSFVITGRLDSLERDECEV
jgi:hypothetical protein